MRGEIAPAFAKDSSKKHVTSVKKLKILKHYGSKNRKEWAKRVLSGGDENRAGLSDDQSDRGHRKRKLDKKPRTAVVLTFSESAKLAGSIVLGVFDRSRVD